MARKWEETPLATVADEFTMLKQRAHAARMRMSIAGRGLMSYV